MDQPTKRRSRAMLGMATVAALIAATVPLAGYAAYGSDGFRDCMNSASGCLPIAVDCERQASSMATMRCFGKTLRGQLRTIGVGTAPIQAGQGVTVRDAAQLRRAIASASSGATIRLAPGRYDPVMIRDKRLSLGTLVVTSADPAQPALMTGVTIRDSSGITLRDLAFDATGAGQQYGVLVLGSNRVGIERARFDDPRGLRTTLSAMMIRNSTDVAVRGSRFRGFWNGISLLDGQNIRLQGNEFEAMQTDGIRGGGVSNLLIEDNVCRGFKPRDKDHPDCIQLWSTRQVKSARDIIVRNNLVVRGDGAPMQGVFIRDTFRNLPFYNVEISGNLMIGAMYNGISGQGLRESRIFGNEVIAEKDMKSWIRLADSHQVDLRDNRAIIFMLDKSNGPITKANNVTTAWSSKGADQRLTRWLEQRPALRGNAGPTLQTVLREYAIR